MTTRHAGNVHKMLIWAYQIEAAGGRFSGPTAQRKTRSSTDLIGRVIALGTTIDGSGAGAIETAQNHAQDAEFIADLVDGLQSGRARALVRRYAKGEWAESFCGIVQPTVVAGPLSPNPHLGQLFSWSYNHQYKGQGKTGSQKTASKVAELIINDPWDMQLRRAENALLFRQSVELIRAEVAAMAHTLTSFLFDPEPPTYSYPTQRLTGDVAVLKGKVQRDPEMVG